jgi:hypothetical protein
MKNTILKKIYLPIFVVLVLGACQPDPLPIKLPPSEGQIVVASQIVPNSTMIVALSRSFNALTQTDSGVGNDLLDQILVSRGFVTVSYNGKTDTLVRVSPGFYGTFTTPLIDNVTYSLKVYDSTTGRTVEAQTQLQPRAKLDSIYILTEIDAGDTNRTLVVNFTDKPGETYYMVNVYRNADFVVGSIVDPSQIFTKNSGVQGTFPISDKLFKNPLHSEKINLTGWFGANDTLTATLSAISADYYTYLVQKQRAARNGLGAFFGEPVNYTTNVRNGLGFFTAHWPDFRQIIIKE